MRKDYEGDFDGEESVQVRRIVDTADRDEFVKEVEEKLREIGESSR